jgi:subtilisin family serine protease
MLLPFMKRTKYTLVRYCLAVFLWACLANAAISQKLERNTDEYDIRLPEGKVHFRVHPKEISVCFIDSATEEQKASFFAAHEDLFGDGPSVLKLPEKDKVYLVSLAAELSGKNYTDALAVLKSSPIIKNVSPVLLYGKNRKQIPYDMFFVKIRNSGGLQTLKKYASVFHFDIEREAYNNIYFCRTHKNSAGNTFEIAAWLQNLDDFQFAEPDFMYIAQCATNDTYYPKQWALHNTGQFPGAVPEDDIDVINAWTITTGIPEVSVAILDVFGDSAQFIHPDFAFANFYNATSTGFAYAYPLNRYSAHGIACGGLIGAYTNNDSGIAGIAYNSKVVAVKVGNFLGNQGGDWEDTTGSYFETTGSSFTDGIEWSLHNCDILSNSNLVGSSNSLIESALDDVINYGRHGKGGFFFSSAGNDDTAAVGYPASSFNAIAVGASNWCDGRKYPGDCMGNSVLEGWGSNNGPNLSMLAPGAGIYALDIAGPTGFVNGDYLSSFDGTSASCPIAAGVMALVLSVDTNLTYDCGRFAIESTCGKVGGYIYQDNVPNEPNGSWCDLAGYGRISAFGAVQYVSSGLKDCSRSETSASAMLVHPNPSSSYFYIDTKIIDTLTISLYDVSGRAVIKNLPVTSNYQAIDVSALETGVYLLFGRNTSGILSTTRVFKFNDFK